MNGSSTSLQLRCAGVLAAGVLLFACAPAARDGGNVEQSRTANAAVSADSFLDKTTAGYQGWFAAAGDGSPVNQWVHWSPTTPSAGNVTFEVYPDTRDYAPEDLYTTALGPLGDGRPSQLYSAYSARVVDTQFGWMEQVGIDGVGLQRFLSELGDGRFLAQRNAVTQNVRSAAEAHGRIFYIEYDISGARGSTLVQDLESDWTNVLVGQLGVTSSPQYVREGGRPVVFLWGFGFGDRPGTPDQAKQAIAWFKSQGCFVAVGVPYFWRTDSTLDHGFLEAYATADLIQPWAVGALATELDVDSHFASIVAADAAWARERGIAYQRVLFPGFAWSNWNGGSHNAIPRHAGSFFWRQAYDLTGTGVSAFIAMFDEYDEGTAIAKAAEDASAIPTSQYFLTLDADGTHVSSDFYLRLAGAATRMIRGEAPRTATIPIPYVGDATPPPSPVAGDPVPAQQPYAAQVATFAPAPAQTIVARLYRGILGREPDPGGMGAYAPLVESGRLPVVASALYTSSEFEARRSGLTTTALAEALYQAILDRGADPGGLSTTADAIHEGHAANRTVDMVLSSEYAANNP